ncbi:MAG: M48 family metalloprotease [Pseudomonadota bacterium]
MLNRFAAALVAIALILPANMAHARGLIRDAEIERTLARLAAPVFRAAGLSEGGVNMFIRNDPSLNAFVFGGRNMVLHTGLLTRLKTPEALMGVMAHEAGHIAGGHLTRRAVAIDRLQGPLAVGTVLAAIAGAAAGRGDVAVAAALGVQSAGQRSILAFSRSEEAAADQAGASYLEAAGVDPGAILEILQLFRGQEVFTAGNVDPYALTHPLSAERIVLLEDRINRSAAKGGKVSEDLAYWHLRMRAKLAAFLSSPRRTLRIIEESENPNNEMNVLSRAIALHLLPDPDGAAAQVDRLIELRPNDPYYWELKGQILFESGRGEAAVGPYRKAVELAPEEKLIRGGLGRALLSLDDPALDAEAVSELEAATRDGQAEPILLRDLALAYARTGEDGKAALATAERYAARGSAEDAYRHATRATDLMPYGSPGWLRADDIRAEAERVLRSSQ